MAKALKMVKNGISGNVGNRPSVSKAISDRLSIVATLMRFSWGGQLEVS